MLASRLSAITLALSSFVTLFTVAAAAPESCPSFTSGKFAGGAVGTGVSADPEEAEMLAMLDAAGLTQCQSCGGTTCSATLHVTGTWHFYIEPGSYDAWGFSSGASYALKCKCD